MCEASCQGVAAMRWPCPPAPSVQQQRRKQRSKVAKTTQNSDMATGLGTSGGERTASSSSDTSRALAGGREGAQGRTENGEDRQEAKMELSEPGAPCRELQHRREGVAFVADDTQRQ